MFAAMQADRWPFSKNASRVEAVSRTLLAIVFAVALWFDTPVPTRSALFGATLLALFVGWSVALVIVAWRSWWWDHWLAVPAHIVDLLLFTAAVYFTEVPSADFSSPFMAFAVLLMIKSRLRWDWRAAMLTAAAMILMNIAMVWGMVEAGWTIDLQRFGRRSMYMTGLALMLTWLGLERRIALDERMAVRPGPPGAGIRPVLDAALAFARQVTGAERAVIAWSAEQEPWIELALASSDEPIRFLQIGPEDLGPEDMDGTFGQPVPALLFDAVRRRGIRLKKGDRREAVTPLPHDPLIARCGAKEGLLVSFSCSTGAGRLVLWDVDGASVDRLILARAAAEEIGRAIDRESLASLAQTAAVSNAHEAIARDLHDSVAQFLAGTMFRLEALRRWSRSGRDPDAEIVAIKEAMRGEQVQLRELIGRLRRGESGDRQTDLATELATLLEELGAHWHVGASLRSETGEVPVAVTLSRDVRQIVREAVANAVRHGACRAVRVVLAQDGEAIRLDIADDGSGMPAGTARPRSISERVAALGGALSIGPAVEDGEGPCGTRLSIDLPLHPGTQRDARLPAAEPA